MRAIVDRHYETTVRAVNPQVHARPCTVLSDRQQTTVGDPRTWWLVSHSRPKPQARRAATQSHTRCGKAANFLLRHGRSGSLVAVCAAAAPPSGSPSPPPLVLVRSLPPLVRSLPSPSPPYSLLLPPCIVNPPSASCVKLQVDCCPFTGLHRAPLPSYICPHLHPSLYRPN